MGKREKYVNIKIIVVFILALSSLVIMTGISESYADGAPKLIISSYSITEGRAAAGEEFKATFTIENQSNTYDADSILITFSNEDNTVLPIYGMTNQVYIDRIPKGTSTDISFAMKVDSAVVEEVLPIDFNIEYAYSDAGTSVANNVTSIVELEPSCKLDVITLSVSDKAYRDGDTYISFYGKNAGNVDIKNLTMEIEGNVLESDKIQNIGNIQSGSAKNQDFCIVVNKLGAQGLSIKFTYQDEYGNEYKVDERNFAVSVIDEEGAGGKDVSIIKTLKESTWQVYAVIVSGVVILALGMVFRKIKKSV